LRVHVIAVGGAAMSAAAHILVRMGHHVSGSDEADSPVLDRLRADGVAVTVGHDALVVDGANLVTISAAVKPGNVELDAAVALGIPVWSRADLMAAISFGRRTLAVSGTHGKTTTSAMTTLVLDAAGWNPSFIVGGHVAALGGGVRWTDSPWFCVEADESDGSFRRFHAEAVVVLNVEPDHLDFHGSMASLEAAFDAFVLDAPGPRVLCGDDPGVQALVGRLSRLGPIDHLLTYGFGETNAVRIVEHTASGLTTASTVVLADGGRVRSW
jgi:UDP-N-acetylmuramate--alanine ligase